MRWMVLAAAAAVVCALWLPGEAAQPAPQPAGAETITFAQYRDWRNNFIERRRSELAIALEATGLPAARRARLEQTKAYYDGLAGLSEAERDRQFRQRFDRIDTDHDGAIDRGERTAWHDQRRAYYHRAATAPPAPTTTP